MDRITLAAAFIMFAGFVAIFGPMAALVIGGGSIIAFAALLEYEEEG